MQLDHRVLGHGLGEAIDVAEAHRPGVLPAALDQAVLDPAVAQALDRARHRRHAGGPDPGARLPAQRVEDLRPPRPLLLHRPQVGQHLRLVAPVEPRVEPHRLLDQAPQHAPYVRGADVDQVGLRTGAAHRFDQARGAQEVGLRGEVGGVVELDRGSGGDHDVAARELRPALLGQAQAVAAEVDLDHVQLLGRQRLERRLADLGLQGLEAGAGQYLALQAVARRAPLGGADGHVDTADLGQRTEDLLDQRLAEVAGGAGDEQRLAGEGFSDQRLRYCPNAGA